MAEEKVNIKQDRALKVLLDVPEVRYLLYGGAAGAGKSWLGCTWLCFMCDTYPNTRWFAARDDLKSSRQSIFVTFGKVAEAYEFEGYRQNDDGIYFANGSVIELVDLKCMPYKDPMFTRLGSREYTGGWIEEAGEVMELAFDVLKSRIGRHLNAEYNIPPKMLITCNPKKNWLYKLFYKPKTENKIGLGTNHPEYEFIQALYTDNPFLTKEYIQGLHDIKDPVTRARLLLGMWEYESDANSLFPDYDALCDMFTNYHVKRTGVKSGGADIAAKGRDRFVAFSADGNVFKLQFNKEYSTGREVEQDLRDVMIREKIPRSLMVVDADGVGSYLESYLVGIKEFHGGGKPRDSKYQNLKAECYFILSDMVRRRTILIEGLSPEEQECLKEELQAVKQIHVDADTKKIAINTKDEQKAILGRSPDIADALMMQMIFRSLLTASSTNLKATKPK